MNKKSQKILGVLETWLVTFGIMSLFTNVYYLITNKLVATDFNELSERINNFIISNGLTIGEWYRNTISAYMSLTLYMAIITFVMTIVWYFKLEDIFKNKFIKYLSVLVLSCVTYFFEITNIFIVLSFVLALNLIIILLKNKSISRKDLIVYLIESFCLFISLFILTRIVPLSYITLSEVNDYFLRLFILTIVIYAIYIFLNNPKIKKYLNFKIKK